MYHLLSLSDPYKYKIGFARTDTVVLDYTNAANYATDQESARTAPAPARPAARHVARPNSSVTMLARTPATAKLVSSCPIQFNRKD